MLHNICDVIPTCSFPALRGLADENAIKVEVVMCAICHEVMIMTDQISESCKRLKQQSRRIRLRVRQDAPDDLAC
jgi:hypothetical protein